MKPMLRAICELVQTGSMLFSAICGTMASVCALPAIAGHANAAAAAPSIRLRRCIVVLPPGFGVSLAQFPCLAHHLLNRLQQRCRQGACRLRLQKAEWRVDVCYLSGTGASIDC